ncbi:MAG: hypothetical protein J6A25_11075 [Lachnospiraceae bacterium]|nr:hypothetical protein [Lachnospiraceae bacterium]
MVFVIMLILIYSLIYLAVFVLAHQDANMIKPLTIMTGGMLVLLAITAVLALASGYWYISLIILVVIVGLLQFFVYLMKY